MTRLCRRSLRLGLGTAMLVLAAGALAPQASADENTSPWAASSGAAEEDHARAAQVTRKEYRRVRDGMTVAKVRNVVGASGKVITDVEGCLLREYSGWGGRRVQVRWQDNGNGLRVDAKISWMPPLQTQFIYCPGVS